MKADSKRIDIYDQSICGELVVINKQKIVGQHRRFWKLKTEMYLFKIHLCYIRFVISTTICNAQNFAAVSLLCGDNIPLSLYQQTLKLSLLIPKIIYRLFEMSATDGEVSISFK